MAGQARYAWTLLRHPFPLLLETPEPIIGDESQIF